MFWWLARVEEGREEVFARGTISFRKTFLHSSSKLNDDIPTLFNLTRTA
jgi:hypothetical protein